MKHRIDMEPEQHQSHQHPQKKEAPPKMAAPKAKVAKVSAKAHRKTSPK